MSYTKKIEVYEIINDIRIPKASTTSEFINAQLGDIVIIIEEGQSEQVYVKDWDNEDGSFTEPTFDAHFVRGNGCIFEKRF